MNNLVFNNDPNCMKTLVYCNNNGVATSLIGDNQGILYVKNVNQNDEAEALPYTAFHDLRVASLTPIVGWTFNYNINTDFVKTTQVGAGTVTQSNGKALVQTGTSTSSSATLQTIGALRYTPGVGALLRFTAIFTTGASGSTQVIGIGDDTDGFFFGYNGTEFGILRRQNSSNNWVAQSDWNVDKLDGSGLSGMTLDQTKGNVYSIQYQWLGFGAIQFMVENPMTGNDILVHRIEYANSNVLPSIYNPTLPITAKVSNTTNSTNIKIETPSAMAFIEGNAALSLNSRHSINGSKTSVTTEAAVLTIRNKTTFQTLTNRVRIRLDYISCTSDGTKFTSFKLIKNATLSGTSYSNISANTSVVEYDTTGSYSSGGTVLLTFECGKVESIQILLDSLNLVFDAGETLTITATSSVTTDVSTSISWAELF